MSVRHLLQQGGTGAALGAPAAASLHAIAAGITVLPDPLPPTPSLVGARIRDASVVAGGATPVAAP